MATVNGQEISNKYGGGIVFANNFTVNTNTPLDVRLTKTTKSELLDPTSWVRNSNGQYLVYTGMLVVVTNDTTASNNGIWEYVGPDDVATANPTLETNWVHLISGETTNTTINAAIDAKIKDLDVNGYAQATITTNTPVGGEDNSTLTISGIQEVDGKIAKDDNNKLVIAIDGTYNETDNKIATQLTVKNAIDGLDSEGTIQAVTFNTPENGGNTTLTFNGVKEENGVITQGASEGAGTFIVGDAKLKIQIGSNENEAFEVFSANAQLNGAIKLNEYVFKKDGDVISVITPTAVSSSNRLVTEQDIANLSGAMHYKGALTGAQDGAGSWPSTVAAGDVYIVTTSFTHSGESNPFEVGDMIVFNTDNNNNYTVVQSNITLGTGTGQVAANVGALVDGNLVVATGTGIETINFDKDNLTRGDRNIRKLTYVNGAADTSDATLFHSATITDTFKVINKNFNQSINISSTNRSIKIARNAGDNDSTGIIVDLVWNTTIE